MHTPNPSNDEILATLCRDVDTASRSRIMAAYYLGAADGLRDEPPSEDPGDLPALLRQQAD